MNTKLARAPDAEPSSEEIPSAIIDAAIAWVVKLQFNQPTPATWQAFEEWRQAQGLHARAWQRVQTLRQDFAAVPTDLARETLRTAETRRQMKRDGRRQAFKLLMLSGAAITGGWLLREPLGWQRLVADAATGVGEQRTVRLGDGTVVVLNTDSAASFDMAAAHRRVVLRRGEIMITTGSDQAYAGLRPFWVDTPFGALQALGTRFVVRLEDGRVRVSVQEGAVRMHPARGGEAVTARVGESWWLRDEGATAAEYLGFRQDDWADGVIAGRNMRLADLLAELSRYRKGRIACDQNVADLRVSGIYHVRDTDQTLRFLAQTQPIRVRYYTRFWVTVEAGR